MRAIFKCDVPRFHNILDNSTSLGLDASVTTTISDTDSAQVTTEGDLFAPQLNLTGGASVGSYVGSDFGAIGLASDIFSEAADVLGAGVDAVVGASKEFGNKAFDIKARDIEGETGRIYNFLGIAVVVAGLAYYFYKKKG